MLSSCVYAAYVYNLETIALPEKQQDSDKCCDSNGESNRYANNGGTDGASWSKGKS